MRSQPNNPLAKAFIMLIIYLTVYYFGGSARALLYPVIWLVAFLHETGHAVGALISGGEVLSLQVNPDGSGLTTTRGGSLAIILMGGYIGSAIFGNVLFYIGIKRRRLAQTALLFLAGLMIFSMIKWPSSGMSMGLLLVYAIVLFFIAMRTTLDQDVALFIGMASVLYIIQDFQVGPSSDLRAYEEHIGILPASAWMYVWLAVVLIITYTNLRRALPSVWGSRGAIK